MVWTDERIATLRRMWAEGYTASLIADAVGAPSRSSVCGKAWRLGLSDTERARRPGENARRARSTPMRRQAKPLRPKCAKEQPVLQPDPVESLNVPLAELGPLQCKAVTDATRFAQRYCGHPAKPGSVYCEGHHRLHHTRVADKAR